MSARPRAMVTGAASGIGRGAALRLLQEGCSVVAVDIDEAGLEATAAEGAEPLAADLDGIKDRGGNNDRRCRRIRQRGRLIPTEFDHLPKNGYTNTLVYIGQS